MLDLARDIIGSQPILTAFLAIGLGYLVGQISIAGFSARGRCGPVRRSCDRRVFAPKAQIIGPIGLTGLIMFLYGIGILYGRQPSSSGMIASRAGNTICWLLLGMPDRFGCGAGAGTHFRNQDRAYAWFICRIDDEQIATLQAALDVMKNKDPSTSATSIACVPLWGHRADPLHLFHDTDRQAQIPGEDAALPYGRDFARPGVCRKEARRTDKQRAR